MRKGNLPFHWLWIAVALVVAAAFGARWLSPHAVSGKAQTVIRLAHCNSRRSVDTALRQLAVEYMRGHPGVEVVIDMVPDQVYLQYLRTQLTGGTAPDILQITSWLTGMDEMRNRYFLPLTRWVTQPNPYNAGTPLAGVPWRDTFVDGLTGSDAYSSELRNYYGITLKLATVRIFCNRDLLRATTGRTALPRTLAELLATCREIDRYSQRTGRYVAPFAGGELPSLFLMAPQFSAVNQKLFMSIDRRRTLALDPWDYAKTYLQGDWSFATPSIRAGYQLMRELARYQKTGFRQLTGGDALFQFLQQQAVMLTAISDDAASMKDQASFPIEAFPIPVPEPGDPDYGRFVLGPISEANTHTSNVFGVVNTSTQRAAAIDFLQFLGSKAADESFARTTGWLPSIEGAEVPAAARPYQPQGLGYPGRFLAEMNGLGDARFRIKSDLHLLFAHNGDVDTFCRRMGEIYGPAMAEDLAKHVKETYRNLGRQEPAILGACQLARRAPAGQGDPTEVWQMISTQNRGEAEALQTRYLLWKTKPAG